MIDLPPSAFPRDPLGHAGNQSAHAWIVGPVLAFPGGQRVAGHRRFRGAGGMGSSAGG